MEGFDLSDEELIRQYYCSKFNEDAVQKRENEREGNLGDKYIVVPRVKKMDGILKIVGAERFFDDGEVLSEGLTVGGFATYVGRLICGVMEYTVREGELGSGWRN